MDFSSAFAAGKRTEQEVVSVLSRYTRHVYENVRVDSLFTKHGYTEIDVVAALAEVLLIVEAKNVSAIEGTDAEGFWRMKGYEAGKEYSTLNVLTQNRIHVRSLKDAWRMYKGEYPCVLSMVVVPNGCVIPEDLHNFGVITVHEFSEQVASFASRGVSTVYGYGLDFLVSDNNYHIRRKDFTGGAV